MFNRVFVGTMGLFLGLLGTSCGEKKDAKSPQAAPSPETTTGNLEAPPSGSGESQNSMPVSPTFFMIPPGLTYAKTSCKDSHGEYDFSTMVFKGSTCDFILHATSDNFDLNDWEAGRIRLEGESHFSPAVGIARRLKLFIDLKKRRLLLSTNFLDRATPNSKLYIGLKQKSTNQLYFLTLEGAKNSDIFERVTLSPSQDLTMGDTTDDGAIIERKALLRTDVTGMPVVRANEMIAFDLKIKTRAGVKIYGLPAGGVIRLQEKYQGLGSFFNDQDKVDRPAILSKSISPFHMWGSNLWNKSVFVGVKPDFFPNLSQYQTTTEDDEPVLYRGIVEGTFTSMIDNGLEVATAPFKFRMIDAVLDQGLEVQLKKDPDGAIQSLSVKNVADYDLRPLVLEFDLECDGRLVQPAGAIFMDPNGQSSQKQTMRMQPGDVWTISNQEIGQALARESSAPSDSPASNSNPCEVADLTMSLREMSYLSGLRLGDILPVEQGRKIKINLGTIGR